MFEQMVENKDPTAIDRFYHPSFVMFSNGVTQDFDEFAASHHAAVWCQVAWQLSSSYRFARNSLVPSVYNLAKRK